MTKAREPGLFLNTKCLLTGDAIEVGLLWLLAHGTSWWQHREMSDAISPLLLSLRHFSDPATYDPYHVIWGWSQWKCGWGQIPLPEQQQHVNEVAVIPHWPWLECLTLRASFRLWEIVLHIKMTCLSIHQQTNLFTFSSLDVSRVQSFCCNAAFKNGIIWYSLSTGHQLCRDTVQDVRFYVLLTVHLGIILVNNQLDAQFFSLYIYFDTLHVSSIQVLIIRRINCINTTSGICHSM